VSVVPSQGDRLYVTVPSQIADLSHIPAQLVAVDRYNNLVRLDTPEFEPASVQESKRAVTPLDNNRDTAVYCGRVSAESTGSRVHIVERKTQLDGLSNPCLKSEGRPRLYWGEIHVHTGQSDGYGTVSDCLAYAREVAGLDFAGAGDHASMMTPSGWERVKDACNRANIPDEFVTLIGYEWADLRFLPQRDGTVKASGGGEANIYTSRDELPLFRALDPGAQGREKLWKLLEPFGEDVVVIPHHPLCRINWDYHNPFFERVIEIYSQWGDAETRDNPRMPNDQFGLSLQELLARDAHVGIIAGSDNHEGRGGLSGINHERCGAYTNIVMKAGLTAVWAEDLTREGIIVALRNRSCYGTTGERIIVEFFVNEQPMGSELALNASQIADSGVSVRATVYGTDAIDTVTVVRNNSKVFESKADAEVVSIEFLDNDVAEAFQAGATVYYYLRVVQRDGNRAWSSPVWVKSVVE
jgi:hypothetical protein